MARIIVDPSAIVHAARSVERPNLCYAKAMAMDMGSLGTATATRIRWSGWILAACTTLVFTGCGKKVDCEQLCDREAACVAEIAIALGTATPEQTARLTPDDKKALGERQRERCRSNCSSPTKPSSVHSKWRRCLENQECAAFAKCVYR